jgi:hypothetical protein
MSLRPAWASKGDPVSKKKKKTLNGINVFILKKRKKPIESVYRKSLFLLKVIIMVSHLKFEYKNSLVISELYLVLQNSIAGNTVLKSYDFIKHYLCVL